VVLGCIMKFRLLRNIGWGKAIEDLLLLVVLRLVNDLDLFMILMW
jgi:hypothetical protein